MVFVLFFLVCPTMKTAPIEIPNEIIAYLTKKFEKKKKIGNFIQEEEEEEEVQLTINATTGTLKRRSFVWTFK